MSYIGPYHHQFAPFPRPPRDTSEWRQAPFFELLRNDLVYQGFLRFIPRHDPHQLREEDLRSWYKAFEILYGALPNCWSLYIELEGRYAPRPADIGPSPATAPPFTGLFSNATRSVSGSLLMAWKASSASPLLPWLARPTIRRSASSFSSTAPKVICFGSPTPNGTAFG